MKKVGKLALGALSVAAAALLTSAPADARVFVGFGVGPGYYGPPPAPYYGYGYCGPYDRWYGPYGCDDYYGYPGPYYYGYGGPVFYGEFGGGFHHHHYWGHGWGGHWHH